MNIKDAYIHNGEAILKDIQVSGSKLQKLKAGKDANDAYLTWVDVLDFSSFGASGHSHTWIGDGTLKMYAHNNNEINFGGTHTGTKIYFGYRATDSRAIPTEFVFGGSAGSAQLTASKVAAGLLALTSTESSATSTAKGINFTNGSSTAHIGLSTLLGIYTSGNIVLRPDSATTDAAGNGSLKLTKDGATLYETLTAEKLVKSGGTSAQFLKADGSVDSNSYSLSTHNHDSSYVTLTTEQTITGVKTFKGSTPQTDGDTVRMAVKLNLNTYSDSAHNVAAIGFANEANSTQWFKGFIGYERTGSYDRGKFVIGLNNTAAQGSATYDDIVASIDATGNITATTFTGTLVGNASSADSVPWTGITGKPDTFPAATHNHDDAYVKLDAGQAEQTIKNTISGISNGSIEIWRAISGGYPMIGFATGTTKTKLGLLGFGTTANEPILRTTGGVDYKLWHAGNLTPKTITLSTSAQTYITAGSTNYTLQMPSTDPYTSARTPSAHDHERIKPTRHDSDDPAPNTKGAYLTFQFSYIGGKWWNVLNMRSYTDMKYVSAELLTPANNPGADTGYSGNMMWRQGRNSTWLDMRTILDSANYTDYTVQKDGTGATGTWGIDISGNATTATTATNSDKVDEHHAMSAGSLLYKYAVTATIPASSVTGDFWYATITFARSYVRELTRSMLDATYSNRQGQVYLNTYEYNGAWYAFTTNYNGSNIKGIAHKSQNNPIYYVKLAKPTTFNNAVPDGTITVYSPYNCTITVSATAPSGVTFTDLITPGFTNLKANSASSADSAATATYASNVGTSADHVTAAQVKALHTWYTTVAGNNASGVIDNWNEIKNFIDGFHETDDLATYLTNTFLAKSGGTMTGPLKWTDSTALPEQTAPQYFLCIDAFNSGGTTKWASKANTLKALTGLTSAAIGDSDEPVYWDGSKFVKAGAYPTKSSWNYDDIYLKLSGGTLTDVLTLKAGTYAADNTWTYPGGSYRSVQKPNLRLIGDPTNGLSTIEFISQAGDTSINKPSDCAFIQFQPHGTTALAAVGSAPTLTTSGEVNRLIIGVNNDSNDILVLQTPDTKGIKHVVGTNMYQVWDSGNDGSGSTLDADLLDGFHAADFRNNIVDLRTSPQTFNPTYLKDIVFISEADYTTLVSNGTITKNSITHTYNASNWYVIEDKVPEYAENAGNAEYASVAGRANSAESADKVEWSGIHNKPLTATRWPGWSEVTDKPTWVTWSETSSTATYSLSNATWTQTITLPTAAGSYILKLVSGNSTLTGVFSIGASDNAKDEISLHLHGNGPRLYARTNGTKLELSRNIATATNTSVTITYRRMI